MASNPQSRLSPNSSFGTIPNSRARGAFAAPHPHPRTLIYSEANLAAGALGAAVYWLTRNAYATHNFVVLLSFVLSAIAMYYLVRHLVHDRRAAIVGALCFA